MTFKSAAKVNLIELKEKWELLQRVPGIFAYTLNVCHSKYLPGEHNFYSELNLERCALRRAPQTIPSLKPKFDGKKFNFKKVNPMEKLAEIPYPDNVALIINNSPLTKYHILICPDVAAELPQCMTESALKFSINLLRQTKEQGFRIGYNSPGALASVNHLHLHLMHIDRDLYIDRAKLKPLTSSYICRLSEDMPTEAICFLFDNTDAEPTTALKINELYCFIKWLIERNLPHNLFMTPQRGELTPNIKVFVYARRNYCNVKDVKETNIGFCELAGYVPVGDPAVFEKLSEQEVINKIRKETGNAYERIYEYFLAKNKPNNFM